MGFVQPLFSIKRWFLIRFSNVGFGRMIECFVFEFCCVKGFFGS